MEDLERALLSNESEEPLVPTEQNDEDTENDTSSLSARDTSDGTGEDENENIGEGILSLAIPALAGLAIDPLMNLVDTAFVGRTATNADALAGVGSATAILTFSFYLFNFLCTVTTPLVSQRRASGDENGAIEIGGQALSLAMVLGTLLSFVLIIFSQQFLEIMGTGATGLEANAYATSFLTVRAIAAPAVFLISASTGILRGYLDTRTTFVILLAANTINFLLDVILIGGLDMGPKGAGIATTTAEWIAAISFLSILAGKIPSADGILGSNQEARRVNGNDLNIPLLEDNSGALQPTETVIVPQIKIPSWESIRPLVIASSSVFVRTFMLQLSIAGAAAMAARTGTGTEVASAGIAAHQIALQLWLLCSFVCDALAAASQALVADKLGRNDEAGVRTVSKTIFVYSVVLGLILAAALEIGDATGFLLGLFTDDHATQEALKSLLLILIAAQPLNSLVFAADGVIQGASEFTFQAKSMVLSSLVGIASFFSLQHFGAAEDTLIHVWESLVILQLMRGITSFWKLTEAKGPIDLFSYREG